MIRKKKIAAAAAIIFVLAAAGICYSCTFKDAGAPPSIVTSLTDTESSPSIVTSLTDTEASPSVVTSLADAGASPSIPKGGTGSVAIEGDRSFAVIEGDRSFAVIEGNPQDGYIYVHLCGAVEKPDVYRIEAGARLVDAIRMAGGLRADAAGDFINQARKLSDGERIYIPTAVETKDMRPEQYIAGEDSGKEEQGEDGRLIDINRADAAELMTIPGIGQVRADSIIEYRNKNGSFKKAEELMNVPGIKDGIFSRISPYITAN